jgi:ppGpp synthetase/RelA/SpoT-type nucleotidyltranferase
MVATEGCQLEISQRLKRVPTIINKLGRYPAMQLATMQDIGGCRAVLTTIDEVHRVQRRLAKRRPPIRVSDYIAEPKISGYRSIHVVVEYDGRAIEIQLRTQAMHAWAFTVERLGGRLQTDLKSGEGPTELLRFMEAASEAMALEEAGQPVDTALVERLATLREAALPFLGGRP